MFVQSSNFRVQFVCTWNMKFTCRFDQRLVPSPCVTSQAFYTCPDIRSTLFIHTNVCIVERTSLWWPPLVDSPDIVDLLSEVKCSIIVDHFGTYWYRLKWCKCLSLLCNTFCRLCKHTSCLFTFVVWNRYAFVFLHFWMTSSVIHLFMRIQPGPLVLCVWCLALLSCCALIESLNIPHYFILILLLRNLSANNFTWKSHGK